MRTHIALPVRNLAASRTFYEAFLGEPVFRRQPGYAQFLTDHLNLALTEDGRTVPSPGHFGLEASSAGEVDAALTRVRGAGIAVDLEEDVLCCYARQQKFWAQDPDGNRWEVFFVRERQLTPVSDGGTACCQGA